MKHALTLILLLPLFAMSQSPVITRSNYFNIGDSALVYYKFDTSLWSISPGASGANASWDFSNMDFNHSSVIVDTLLFISPVGTPFYPVNLSADYSQSNICMLRKSESFSTTNDDYNYYYVNNDSLSFIGHWAANGGTELWEDHCDDVIRELAFPFSYGDAYVDSFTRFFNDLSGSGSHYQSGTHSVEADGYGTMMTPEGTTLNNVLRLHIKTTTKDSSSMGVSVYSLHKYSWYADSKKGFVLTLNMAFSDSTAVETAEYQKQTNVVTSIHEKQLSGNRLSIYPNPASDIVTFSVDDKLESLKLYNTLGQFLKAYEVTQQLSVSVDINGLAKGLYFVEAVSSNEKTYRSKLLVK